MGVGVRKKAMVAERAAAPMYSMPKLATGPGLAVVVKDTEGREGAAETVRRVGSKTFYYKDGGWIDSTVGAGELAKAIILEQFGDDYFRLVRGQGAEDNIYFTFADRVTVKLAGTVYRVEPVAP